jgi:polyhydroxyalkanoate synthesis regulator phasin
VAEAFQAYINKVTGVTRSTQAKAEATARALLRQSGMEAVATETGERATKLAEEIMTASRANRELLQHFVSAEVDKLAARLGFARAEEVRALRDEIAGLRVQLDEVMARSAKSATGSRAAGRRAPAKKTAAAMKLPNTATTRAPGQKPPRAAASSDSALDTDEQ